MQICLLYSENTTRIEQDSKVLGLEDPGTECTCVMTTLELIYPEMQSVVDSTAPHTNPGESKPFQSLPPPPHPPAHTHPYLQQQDGNDVGEALAVAHLRVVHRVGLADLLQELLEILLEVGVAHKGPLYVPAADASSG